MKRIRPRPKLKTNRQININDPRLNAKIDKKDAEDLLIENETQIEIDEEFEPLLKIEPIEYTPSIIGAPPVNKNQSIMLGQSTEDMRFQEHPLTTKEELVKFIEDGAFTPNEILEGEQTLKLTASELADMEYLNPESVGTPIGENENGETIYKVESDGRYDPETRAITLSSEAPLFTVIEEAAHGAVHSIRDREPGFNAELREWGERLDPNKELPNSGEELFVKAYLANRLTYAKEFPELANVLKMNDEMIVKMDAYLGTGKDGVNRINKLFNPHKATEVYTADEIRLKAIQDSRDTEEFAKTTKKGRWEEDVDVYDGVAYPRSIAGPDKGRWFRTIKGTKSIPPSDIISIKSADSYPKGLQQPAKGKTEKGVLFHVTPTKNIPMIKKEGLTTDPKRTPLWNKARGGEYGEGEVYAFENLNDALGWAQKMEFDLGIPRSETSIIKISKQPRAKSSLTPDKLKKAIDSDNASDIVKYALKQMPEDVMKVERFIEKMQPSFEFQQMKAQLMKNLPPWQVDMLFLDAWGKKPKDMITKEELLQRYYEYSYSPVTNPHKDYPSINWSYAKLIDENLTKVMRENTYDKPPEDKLIKRDGNIFRLDMKKFEKVLDSKTSEVIGRMHNMGKLGEDDSVMFKHTLLYEKLANINFSSFPKGDSNNRAAKDYIAQEMHRVITNAAEGKLQPIPRDVSDINYEPWSIHRQQANVYNALDYSYYTDIVKWHNSPYKSLLKAVREAASFVSGDRMYDRIADLMIIRGTYNKHFNDEYDNNFLHLRGQSLLGMGKNSGDIFLNIDETQADYGHSVIENRAGYYKKLAEFYTRIEDIDLNTARNKVREMFPIKQIQRELLQWELGSNSRTKEALDKVFDTKLKDSKELLKEKEDFENLIEDFTNVGNRGIHFKAFDYDTYKKLPDELEHHDSSSAKIAELNEDFNDKFVEALTQGDVLSRVDKVVQFLTEYHPPEGKIRILIETKDELRYSKRFGGNKLISPFLSEVTESFPRKNKDLHYYELTIPKTFFLREAALTMYNNSKYMLADAPFTQRQKWVELSIQHAVRRAVDQGINKITWSPANVQRERYRDIRKFKTFIVGVPNKLQEAIQSMNNHGNLTLQEFRSEQKLDMKDMSASQMSGISEKEFIRHYGNKVLDKIRNGDYKASQLDGYHDTNFKYYHIPITDVLSSSSFFDDIYGNGINRPNDLAKAVKKLYKTNTQSFHVGNKKGTPIPVGLSNLHEPILLKLQEHTGRHTLNPEAKQATIEYFYATLGQPLNMCFAVETGAVQANMSVTKLYSFNKIFHNSPEFEKMWNKHFKPYLEKLSKANKELFSDKLKKSTSDIVNSIFERTGGYEGKTALTFNQVLDVNLLKNRKIPGGSVRDVYQLSDKLVVKIANSPKGLEQNHLAGEIYADVPKVYERGLDYIVVENIPRNDKAIRKFLKPLQKFSAIDYKNKNPELIKTMEKMGLGDYINYNLLWNDFKAYRNWGMEKDGFPRLIDEGALSDAITSTSTPHPEYVEEWNLIKQRRKFNKDKFNGDNTVKSIFKKLVESDQFHSMGRIGQRDFRELLAPTKRGKDKSSEQNALGKLYAAYSQELLKFQANNLDKYSKLEDKAKAQEKIYRDKWIADNPNVQGKKVYHEGFEIPEKAIENAHEVKYSFRKRNPKKPSVSPEFQPMKKIKKQVNSFVEFFKDNFQTTLYRIRKISPDIAVMLTKHDSKLLMTQTDRTMQITGFRDWLRKLRKKDPARYVEIDVALKNGQFDFVLDEARRDGVEQEFFKTIAVLEQMGGEFVDTNVLHPDSIMENYFPRQVGDVDGLKISLGSTKIGLIDKAIATATKTKGRPLSEYEKADVINNVLAGYGHYVDGGIRWNKARTIEELPPDLNQFYLGSEDALLNFVVQGTSHIEQRRFFGAGKYIDENGKDTRVYDGDSVGEYIQHLLDTNLLSPKDQHELRRLLDFRFSPTAFSSGAMAYKNIVYTWTLGAMDSWISQLQDMGLTIYFEKANLGLRAVPPMLRSVVRNAIKYITFGKYKPTIGKRDIDREMLGVDKIWFEQDNMQSFTAQAVQTVFKVNGMEAADGVGKESHVNTVLGKLRRQARKALKDGKIPFELKKWLGRGFTEPEWDKVIKELDSGEITDNVKLLAFTVLMNIHPITKSNVAMGYDKHPFMYQLRTFAMNQLNFLAQEFKDAWGAGRKAKGFLNKAKMKAKAVNDLGWAVALLVLAGAGWQSVKDWINGRELRFSDHALSNLLRMLFLSRYHFWKIQDQIDLAGGEKKYGKKEENIANILIDSVLPAGFTIPGIFALDGIRIGNYMWEEEVDEYGDKILRPNLLQRLDGVYYIPFIGHQTYWWYGKGEIKEKTRQYYRIKKDIETIREEKKLKRKDGVQNFLDVEDATIFVEHMLYLKSLGELTPNAFKTQLGDLLGELDPYYLEVAKELQLQKKKKDIKKMKKEIEDGTYDPPIKKKKKKKKKRRKIN